MADRTPAPVRVYRGGETHVALAAEGLTLLRWWRERSPRAAGEHCDLRGLGGWEPMSRWGRAEPAWWLNLQAHPDAVAQTRDGIRQVRARRAQGQERQRLWSRWAQIDTDLDDYAARRPTETAVVILEPRDPASTGP